MGGSRYLPRMGTCDQCRALVTFTPMPLRRVVALLVLAGSASVTLWACDSDGRKDQNYGTDVGDKWVPTEAGPGRDPEPMRDAAPSSADATAGGDDAPDATFADTRS